MKKAPLFSISALLLVGLVAAGAFAMPFGGFGKRGMFGSNDAIKEALEAGDYEAYMSALEENWKAYKAELTEERFNEIVERHNQMAENRAAMQETREHRYQEMAEKRVAMQETNEKIQQALENGDYNAWKEAVSTSGRSSRIAEKITEENFDTYVKLHEARQNKDWETAKELAEELGLGKQGIYKGFDKGRFGHRMHYR